MDFVKFFDEAESWARNRDSLAADQRGPLHGLPISVKECYQVQGFDSTAGKKKLKTFLVRTLFTFDLFLSSGLAYNLFKPAEEHSLIVQQLISLGAVPFCHTNVPQTMYSLQSSNPIYGATGNPFDKNRECGGSSGGEGALVGGGGSVLGVGNDVGGSVRSPAALCGIYSLRPTHGRHLTQIRVRIEPKKQLCSFCSFL